MSRVSPSSAAVAALLAATLLAGCSFLSPKPKNAGASFAEAEDAVREAERARVGDYDATGLRTAQRQLKVTKALAADPKRQELASWLAAQTIADADLTVARAARARTFAYYDYLRSTAAAAAPAAGAKP